VAVIEFNLPTGPGSHFENHKTFRIRPGSDCFRPDRDFKKGKSAHLWCAGLLLDYALREKLSSSLTCSVKHSGPHPRGAFGASVPHVLLRPENVLCSLFQAYNKNKNLDT